MLKEESIYSIQSKLLHVSLKYIHNCFDYYYKLLHIITNYISHNTVGNKTKQSLQHNAHTNVHVHRSYHSILRNTRNEKQTKTNNDNIVLLNALRKY